MRQEPRKHTFGTQINRVGVKCAIILGNGLRNQGDYNQQKQHLSLTVEVIDPSTMIDTNHGASWKQRIGESS